MGTASVRASSFTVAAVELAASGVAVVVGVLAWARAEPEPEQKTRIAGSYRQVRTLYCVTGSSTLAWVDLLPSDLPPGRD